MRELVKDVISEDDSDDELHRFALARVLFSHIKIVSTTTYKNRSTCTETTKSGKMNEPLNL
jgi:hypothetical protein